MNDRYERLTNWEGHPPLQEQAMLGAALLTAKICLSKRKYQPWVREYTNLNLRTARRFKERFWHYLATKHQEEKEEAEVDERMMELLFPPEALKKSQKKKALR